jgi:hypothetical protein
MSSLHHVGHAGIANIDRMMEWLGIDVGCRVTTRFDLLFCCALRNCGHRQAHEACARWLKDEHLPLAGPPKFCPNFDILSELFYDPAIGHRTVRAQPVSDGVRSV